MLLVLLGSCSGVVYGFLLARATVKPSEPMAWTDDISYVIPSLRVEGYSDSELVLHTDKIGLRIAMDDQVLSAPPDTSFRLPLAADLKIATAATGSGTATAASPQTCAFVAGTTGKYVYPADDSRGKRLKNPRCFSTQQEGIAAGLLVPEK